MKLYDLIKSLLTENPNLRNSDRLLTWEVWKKQGAIKGNNISLDDFLSSENTETIRRTRQKVQENFPHLQADKCVLERRREIMSKKGTHVYREKVAVFDDATNTVRYEYVVVN